MKKMLGLILLLALFILPGCGGGSTGGGWNCNNCDDEINDTIAKNGMPEEINRYDSGDYHSHKFWYWCRGWEITFTWGKDTGKCCDWSTYTFSPIGTCPSKDTNLSEWNIQKNRDAVREERDHPKSQVNEQKQ